MSPKELTTLLRLLNNIENRPFFSFSQAPDEKNFFKAIDTLKPEIQKTIDTLKAKDKWDMDAQHLCQVYCAFRFLTNKFEAYRGFFNELYERFPVSWLTAEQFKETLLAFTQNPGIGQMLFTVFIRKERDSCMDYLAQINPGNLIQNAATAKEDSRYFYELLRIFLPLAIAYLYEFRFTGIDAHFQATLTAIQNFIKPAQGNILREIFKDPKLGPFPPLQLSFLSLFFPELKHLDRAPLDRKFIINLRTLRYIYQFNPQALIHDTLLRLDDQPTFKMDYDVRLLEDLLAKKSSFPGHMLSMMILQNQEDSLPHLPPELESFILKTPNLRLPPQALNCCIQRIISLGLYRLSHQERLFLTKDLGWEHLLPVQWPRDRFDETFATIFSYLSRKDLGPEFSPRAVCHMFYTLFFLNANPVAISPECAALLCQHTPELLDRLIQHTPHSLRPFIIPPRIILQAYADYLNEERNTAHHEAFFTPFFREFLNQILKYLNDQAPINYPALLECFKHPIIFSWIEKNCSKAYQTLLDTALERIEHGYQQAMCFNSELACLKIQVARLRACRSECLPLILYNAIRLLSDSNLFTFPAFTSPLRGATSEITKSNFKKHIRYVEELISFVSEACALNLAHRQSEFAQLLETYQEYQRQLRAWHYQPQSIQRVLSTEEIPLDKLPAPDIPGGISIPWQEAVNTLFALLRKHQIQGANQPKDYAVKKDDPLDERTFHAITQVFTSFPEHFERRLLELRRFINNLGPFLSLMKAMQSELQHLVYADPDPSYLPDQPPYLIPETYQSRQAELEKAYQNALLIQGYLHYLEHQMSRCAATQGTAHAVRIEAVALRSARPRLAEPLPLLIQTIQAQRTALVQHYQSLFVEQRQQLEQEFNLLSSELQTLTTLLNVYSIQVNKFYLKYPHLKESEQMPQRPALTLPPQAPVPAVPPEVQDVQLPNIPAVIAEPPIPTTWQTDFRDIFSALDTFLTQLKIPNYVSAVDQVRTEVLIELDSEDASSVKALLARPISTFSCNAEFLTRQTQELQALLEALDEGNTIFKQEMGLNPVPLEGPMQAAHVAVHPEENPSNSP